jgi:hypothetical protein
MNELTEKEKAFYKEPNEYSTQDHCAFLGFSKAWDIQQSKIDELEEKLSVELEIRRELYDPLSVQLEDFVKALEKIEKYTFLSVLEIPHRTSEAEIAHEALEKYRGNKK